MSEETTVFTPASEFVIHDLETLKVLADPLRLNIIEYLIAPSTVKEVAEKIDKPPTKLYYHFNLLEKHNLIKMVFTRIVSGIVEKHYIASAHIYRIAPSLLAPGSADFEEYLEITLSGLYGDTFNDIRESLRAGVIDVGENPVHHRKLRMFQGKVYMTDEEAIEFYRRLDELFDEFAIGKTPQSPDDMKGRDAYRMLMLWHPSSRRDKK
ncbi:MAG: helix-turn-helix domain-containing protein [Anaerolineae bacterium]|nr:helix-turn-helix domain-containing protein [Anaerolineae bacterium]